MELFVNLLLSHLIGDFWLQSDKLCKQKQDQKLKSGFLSVHSLIMGLLAFLFSKCTLSFIPFAAIIMITHFAIDIIKSYIKTYPLVTFCVDQLLHVAILYFVSQLFFESMLWTQFAFIPQGYEMKIPLLLCAIVVCCGASNIFIKLVLERFHINLPKSKDSELDKAGGLIGNLERLMCLAFVIIGQYEAIGFILAAKSILRFRDYEHSKTEYVLAGSMLSFGIALLCGLAFRIFT